MKSRLLITLIAWILLVGYSFAETVTIQVLQTSDLHGKFFPYMYAWDSEDKSGSLVQISTVIEKLRKENKNTILIDTGDTIQDNSNELFEKEKINPMIIGFNKIKYDAWILGNHEFNFGVPYLEKVMSTINAPVLTGNLYNKDGTLFTSPYIIKELNGIKIAIIGMTNPHIKKWDSENLKDYKTTNPILETKKIVKKIKNSVDIIIVATHLSPDGEYGFGDSASDIAKQIPEVTVVFAAHKHALVNERVNGTPVLEPLYSGKYLSQVLISLTKEKDKWIIKDKNQDIQSNLIKIEGAKVDQELYKSLTPYHNVALSDARQVIGVLKGDDLVKKNEIKGIPQAQIEPTALISFINEVQMYYTKADISSVALFNLDANIKQGKIKKSDVSLIYKYDNTLRVYELTGKQLKKYMEWSAEYFNQYQEGDLTISFNENIRAYNYDIFSGIKYEINISKPIGQRIENLRKLDDTPIKDTDKFTVAVNDYRGKSTLLAENNGLFKPSEIKLVKDLYDTMGDNSRIRSLIIDYIQNHQKGSISPKNDNNWIITGTTWNKKDREKIINLVNNNKISIPTSEDQRTPNIRSLTLKDIP